MSAYRKGLEAKCKKREKYLRYKQYRNDRFEAGEDLSTSEDEDGNKKTGYEQTKYMENYFRKT